MTVPPIIRTHAVGRAKSGRWWWSCCHPACTEYHSSYLTEDSAQRDAYKHERKEHR